jgi:hypothetical protein
MPFVTVQSGRKETNQPSTVPAAVSSVHSTWSEAGSPRDLETHDLNGTAAMSPACADMLARVAGGGVGDALAARVEEPHEHTTAAATKTVATRPAVDWSQAPAISVRRQV